MKRTAFTYLHTEGILLLGLKKIIISPLLLDLLAGLHKNYYMKINETRIE